MSKFLLTMCAFGLLLSSAFAEEKSPEQHREESNQIIRLQKIDWTRIVASGTNLGSAFSTQSTPIAPLAVISISVLPNNQNTARSRLRL